MLEVEASFSGFWLAYYENKSVNDAARQFVYVLQPPFVCVAVRAQLCMLTVLCDALRPICFVRNLSKSFKSLTVIAATSMLPKNGIR